MTTRARVPALDGWRGVAIILVLADHYQHFLQHWFPDRLLFTGQHGVTIFFVLSGYLITSKLLECDIDLRRFYTRRFFRLQPVVWVYLLFLFILDAWLHPRPLFNQHPYGSLFFFRNFIPPLGNAWDCTGQFWSLSIEEQFYLIWPAVLLFAGKRKGLWIATSAFLACALYRYLNWSRYAVLGPNFYTQVRADALFVGCALGIALSYTTGREIVGRISRAAFLPCLIILIYCMCGTDTFRWLPPLIENLSVALLIAAVVLRPESITARLLSFRPLTWLGLISYSVYVWQQFFVKGGGSWSLFVFLPAFSILSYYFIERPGQRWGNRLASRKLPTLDPQPA